MKYFLILSIGLLAACQPTDSPIGNPADPPIVGNDRDAHGCIPSAGYQWSKEKQECVRPWEE